MKKDWNSISQNMTLQGIMWRLGSFFSLLLIFTSTSLFATENPSSETFVHAESVVENIQTDLPEKPLMYVADGTVVYGFENLSQIADKHTVKKKTIQKIFSKKTRRIAVVEKITQKAKSQQKDKNPETIAYFNYHESKGSFNVSKHQFVAGALTFNHPYKAITVHNNYIVFLQSISNECAIHTYAFSFTPNTINAHSFSRPPPLI